MLKRVSNALLWVLMFLLLIASSCIEGPPLVKFRDLIENRISYERDLWPREYTEGIVIYLTRKNGREFFVVTYPGASKERVEDNFIIVKATIEIKGLVLTVGDIVSIYGTVKKATRRTKNDKSVTTVYYLNGEHLIKTGKANIIEDSGLEELIRVVSKEMQRKDSALDFLAIYSIVFLPTFR